MDTPEQPQLYLITPPELELSSFPDQLARVLDAHDVACVRLALSTRDEDRVMRAADALLQAERADRLPRLDGAADAAIGLGLKRLRDGGEGRRHHRRRRLAGISHRWI